MVTILGYIVIFWALVYLAISLIWIATGSILVVIGILGLVYSLWRLAIGFGILSMKRKAWKPAIFAVLIFMVIDLIRGQGLMVLLEIFTLLYLLAIRKQFYR